MIDEDKPWDWLLDWPALQHHAAGFYALGKVTRYSPMKQLIHLTLLATCLGSVVAVYSTTMAHSEATGIVKERMDAMKDMGKKSTRVARMLRGQEVFDKQALITAADAFVLHGTQMKRLFPDTHESRMGKTTEALPNIWQNWDRFSSDVDEFIMLSQTLQQTVNTTDNRRELKKAFRQTAESCSGCHKAFRQPDK